MIDRRSFMTVASITGAAAVRRQGYAQHSQVEDPPLLNAATHPKFIVPVAVPPLIDARAGGHFDIGVSEFTQSLGLFAPGDNLPLTTKLWGYHGSYPGPTILARRNVPVSVKWTNGLGGKKHLLPIDTSLHWANPLGLTHAARGYSGPVPIVAHLHGGHTRSDSDGLPDAWFTPGFAQTGRLFNPVYTYDNDQEAATLWYHDHALGVTRLNVYAGLAGFYLLSDANEDALNLPSGPYEIGLAIQDRMFTADGQLYYPSEPEEPGAPEPSVLPEFFGDFILVNGRAWPFLEVEPRLYRFRMLNGSDSRFYTLYLSSGQRIWQIGTDSGLLNEPVSMDQLTLGPGERADVLLDFTNRAGQQIILRNHARAPFPKGAAPDPRTVGQIMAFRVTKPLNTVVPLATIPSSLRPLAGPIQSLGQTGTTRKLLLFEGADQYGRLQPALGTINGALLWSDPVTEEPRLNDIEVWEVYNSTEDAHPIHLHLVSFQIVSRQHFSAYQNPTTGALSGIRLMGRPKVPQPNERGWKDTAIMFPGEVTRIIAKFDRRGEYVWHCHILSHEDHEMMRPYRVV